MGPERQFGGRSLVIALLASLSVVASFALGLRLEASGGPQEAESREGVGTQNGTVDATSDVPPEPSEVDEESPSSEEGGPPAPEAPATAADSDSEPDPESGADSIPVRGSFSTRYRLRWTGSDSDQDLFSVLNLEIGDPGRQAVTGYVLARGSADLDGNRENDGFFVFDGIDDTFDTAVNGRLYYAYVDYHRLEGFDIVRFGRQNIVETPEVAYFDGIRLQTAPYGDLDLRFGAYGGLSTHIYESSNDGDYLVGSYAEARPLEGARARLDWMFARDDERFSTSESTNDNHLLSIGWWQQVAEGVQLHGAYSWLEDSPRDLLLRGDVYDADSDLRFRASYFRLLTTQRDLALEFDPFYALLLEQEPYNQVDALVSKGFGDHFGIDVGITARQLDDDGDVGPNNREFERYYVTPSVYDVLLDGLTASVTFDKWDDSDNDIETWGFDVSQKLDERWTASAGTFYSLYKFDIGTASEREDVRTYYIRFDWDVRDDLRLDVDYQYEEDDFEEYSTLRLGAAWSF